MGGVGRNDPCPCGSGKKYKKCCLGKDTAERRQVPAQKKIERATAAGAMPVFVPEELSQKLLSAGPVEFEMVAYTSTAEILAKLKKCGVPMTREEFRRQAPQFPSAEALAEDWYDKYPVNVSAGDEDFVWMAATVLWRRLTPQLVSDELLDDMMQRGYELVEGPRMEEGCRIWLEVWDHLEKRFTPKMKSIQQAEAVFEGLQCLYNWTQDVDEALQNARLYRERLVFCRECYTLFPASDESWLLNMKRSAGESCFALGLTEEGDKTFASLVEEFPRNPWPYIGWGDAYADLPPVEGATPPDADKAQRFYRLALERADDRQDRDIIMARLDEVRTARGSL